MLKWNVRKSGDTDQYHIRNSFRIVAKGLSQAQAENLAAAHNAVIDMAFDSPGNVS